jgi:integrase
VIPPKVSQLEPETYTPDHIRWLLEATPAGWHRLAVRILLGTRMRLFEMYALDLDDFEDDGEARS